MISAIRGLPGAVDFEAVPDGDSLAPHPESVSRPNANAMASVGLNLHCQLRKGEWSSVGTGFMAGDPRFVSAADWRAGPGLQSHANAVRDARSDSGSSRARSPRTA